MQHSLLSIDTKNDYIYVLRIDAQRQDDRVRNEMWESKDKGFSWEKNSNAGILQRIASSDGTIYLLSNAFEDAGVIKIAPDGKSNKLKMDAVPRYIAASFSDSQQLYAVYRYEYPNANDGVLKSEDGGFSWTQIDFGKCLQTTEENNLYIINTIEINPLSPDIVYAVAEMKSTSFFNGKSIFKVIKTADGGKTWLDISRKKEENGMTKLLNSSVESLLIDPVNPEIVYVTSANGVCRSDDGGKTWKSKLPKDTLNKKDIVFRNISVNPSNPKTVYLATNKYIYKSIDRGNTWQNIARGAVNKILVSSGLVLIDTDNGVYTLLE